MKKLTQRELKELIEGNADSDALNSKEKKERKKKRIHIYNKESK